MTHSGKRSRRRRHLHLVGEAEPPPPPSRDELLKAELSDLREEMEVMSGQVLPRTAALTPVEFAKRPWWESRWFATLVVLALVGLAALVAYACQNKAWVKFPG